MRKKYTHVGIVIDAVNPFLGDTGSFLDSLHLPTDGKCPPEKSGPCQQWRARNC